MMADDSDCSETSSLCHDGLRETGEGDVTVNRGCLSNTDQDTNSYVEDDVDVKKLKEVQERTMNLFNSLCGKKSMAGNEEFESKLHAYQEEQGGTRSTTLETFPNFDGSCSELLNMSIGSMQNIIKQRAGDNVRDFSRGDTMLEKPKVVKGVQLDPRICVHQYEMSSSDEGGSDDESYKENRSIQIHNSTRQSAMARIEDMWDTFRIDEYAPWSSFRQSLKLKRSQSLIKFDSSSRKKPSESRPWKKRVTEPDPPTMLMREANKTPRKTKAMIELDCRRVEKERLEELECRKQFRASPAPDHIRLRLFEEMNRQQEERRKYLRENGEEILRSMQEPFEFLEREEQRKKERVKETKMVSADSKQNRLFRARPFPAYIFDGSVDDKILEEEEYRRIRMRMRADELMSSSTLPYSMRIRGAGDGKHRHSTDKEPRFHPQVNQTIPDFDGQYQRFTEELIKRKQRREPTACEPFNLRQPKHLAGRRQKTCSEQSQHAVVNTQQSQHAVVNAHDLHKHSRLKQRRRSRSLSPLFLDSPPPPPTAVADELEVQPSEKDDDSSNEIDFMMNRNSSRWKLQETNNARDDHEKDKSSRWLKSRAANFTHDVIVDNRDDACESLKSSASSVTSRNDFWSHPSLVRRLQFWANPVISVD